MPGMIDPRPYNVQNFCGRLPTALKLRGLWDKVTLRTLARRSLPAEIWQRPKKPYRAPMTTVLFGPDAPEFVGELLSEAALTRFGLLEARAASRLVKKAHQQAGRMGGEREEMALVGMLTLRLLAHFFLERFAARAAELRQQLDRQAPDVVEDRVLVSAESTQ